MSAPATREEQTVRLYEAFAAADFDALADAVHPQVEFVNPSDAVEPGTRIGPAAFVRAVARLHDLFDYDAAEVVEFVGRGDEVVAVVRFRVRGRGSDVPMNAQFAHHLSWTGDKLRRLEWYRDRQEALTALEQAATPR